MERAVPVSLILSVFNEGARLRQTVDSVLAARQLPVEIIVVDDGSIDACADALASLDGAPYRLMVFRRAHEGIAGARQFGVSQASQPVLVFLDAHCHVDPDWLGSLLEPVLRADVIAIPCVGDSRRPADVGCGARLINDVLAYQWVTGRPPPQEVAIAPGGCFAMLRNTLERIGGFAAMRDSGLEDVELSLRAWRFGLPIVTAAASSVLHDFRHEAPYTSSPESWLANVFLTALLHFDEQRLKRTLLAAAGFSSFSAAITSVLCSGWLERKNWIDANARRPLRDYWAQFESS